MNSGKIKNKANGGSRFQGRKIVNKWYGIFKSGDISVMHYVTTTAGFDEY